MKIMKMSNKSHFRTNVYVALNTIENRLKDSKCNYSTIAKSITIKDVTDKNRNGIESIVENAVTEVFHCKDSKKVCKKNTFNNNLYIRFKKAI